LELSSQQLKKSGFEAARENVFAVSAEAVPELVYSLTLTDLRSRPAPPGYEQFSMLFTGPALPLLPQGVYCFKHDRLGELPLLMVPISRGEDSAQYEVCISRSTADD
jgi:hypothetical protein